MAFDDKIHEIDPQTGFVIHKEKGHRVGLDPEPPKSTHEDPEWPKWVTPHHGHVKRQAAPGGPAHVSTPRFPEYHVDRDGEVTVLVRTPEEEALALADPNEQPPAAA